MQDANIHIIHVPFVSLRVHLLGERLDKFRDASERDSMSGSMDLLQRIVSCNCNVSKEFKKGISFKHIKAQNTSNNNAKEKLRDINILSTT